MNKSEKTNFKLKVRKINNDNKKHRGTKLVPNTIGNIVDFYNVNKTFTNGHVIENVLNDITLSIKDGEFVVFLGKSGSGKTTLMNIMSGLMRATNGVTIVGGTNLINLSDNELTNFRRKNIGYIFQEYGLLNTLTVYENIVTGYNLNKSGNKKMIDDLIDNLDLTLHKNKFPLELSGGQQQRVSIARAIAKNPKIIFCDEPTGALDSKMSDVILKLLKKINELNRTTIVLITHDKKLVDYANVVYIVEDKKIRKWEKR